MPISIVLNMNKVKCYKEKFYFWTPYNANLIINGFVPGSLILWVKSDHSNTEGYNSNNCW